MRVHGSHGRIDDLDVFIGKQGIELRRQKSINTVIFVGKTHRCRTTQHVNTKTIVVIRLLERVLQRTHIE